MNHFDLDSWLRSGRAEIDALLAARLAGLPASQDPGRLLESMRYSLLAPGKRLRPLLVLAAARAVGAEPDEPIRIAAGAVELIHCYSLVHDDLPAMDDDDFRRGRPTNHKAFGEATAILAGDALLTLAFEWMAEAAERASSKPGADAAVVAMRYLAAIKALAQGAGMSGMVRGQSRDLLRPEPSTIDDLESLHADKTGALFRSALEVGATIAGASAEQRQALVEFGKDYGLAFQHADDLADEDHSALQTTVRQRIHLLTRSALEALAIFDSRAEALRALATRLGDEHQPRLM